MKIGGGELVELPLEEGEELVRESRGDVEEVSRLRDAANPLRVFASGGRFHVGRLVLTDRRLILVPYAPGSDEGAQVLQRAVFEALGQIGLRMPRPEVELVREPLVVHLGEVRSVDPHQVMLRVHPLLIVHAMGAEHAFKLSPPESPSAWAEEIRRLTGCVLEGGEV